MCRGPASILLTIRSLCRMRCAICARSAARTQREGAAGEAAAVEDDHALLLQLELLHVPVHRGCVIGGGPQALVDPQLLGARRPLDSPVRSIVNELGRVSIKMYVWMSCSRSNLNGT